MASAEPLCWLPVASFSFAASGAADQPVATEEDQTAGEQACGSPAVLGSRFDGLLDQVEGERTDQHASAKAHD
jgi:hypothetical protein